MLRSDGAGTCLICLAYLLGRFQAAQNGPRISAPTYLDYLPESPLYWGFRQAGGSCSAARTPRGRCKRLRCEATTPTFDGSDIIFVLVDEWLPREPHGRRTKP